MRRRTQLQTIAIVLISLSLQASTVSAQSMTANGTQSVPAKPRRLTAVPEEPPATDLFRTELVRSKAVINDSRLNDICCVGSSCWVVGENGVLLRSTDSGASFEESILPFPCSLNSVSFLTNQIGFVAGSRFDFHSGWQKAVLLKTLDGGQTWSDLSDASHGNASEPLKTAAMPPIADCRFFDLENGICITEPSRSVTTAGVYRTTDGGVSWKLLKASSPGNADDLTVEWKRLCFTSSRQGLLVGQQTAIGSVIGNKLIVLSPAQRTLMAMSDAVLQENGDGWIVGDSGTVMKSTDGGLVWRPVNNILPSEQNHLLDFHCVCREGSTILIAGRPGNRIFRSDDAGQSWNVVNSGTTLPINRMKFVGEDSVIAIGAMGTLLRSTDRGQSWTPIRNDGYRAAVASFTTQLNDLPAELLANVCSEEGYRAVVIQPSMRLREGHPIDLRTGRAARRRLNEIAIADFCQDWMFARNNPKHIERANEVLESWQGQTDGLVVQQLPERLAMWIRTWRPDAICVDSAGPDDGVATFLLQALPTACQIAAGEVKVSAAMKSTQLPLWSVKRIVQRSFDGRTTSLTYSENDLLKRAGSSTGLLTKSLIRTTATTTSLGDTDELQTQTRTNRSTSYKVILDRTGNTATPHLLAGFASVPGSDCRRVIDVPSDSQSEQLERVLQTVALQNDVAKSRVQRNDRSLGLIAELSTMNQTLPPTLAIQQMENLIAIYRRVGNLDGQISVMKELVQRYPESEAGVQASVDLFHYFSSAELRRLRKQRAAESGVANASPSDSIAKQVAADQRRSDITQAGGVLQDVEIQPGQGTLFANRIGSDTEALELQWNRNAGQVFQQLQRVAPETLSSAAIRLQQAALLRRSGQPGRATTVLSEVARMEDPMSVLAAAEIGAQNGAQLSAVRRLNIPPTQSKPWLDGLLDDQCWIDAEELHLKATQNADARSQTPCLVMLSWDRDCLYVAGRIDRIATKPNEAKPTKDRIRDADHDGVDRIEIALDIDRDYSSAYVLTIDERGQTSDACWYDRTWDPEWFVASDQDATTWRFEIAIPLPELVEHPVEPGQLWSIRLARTAPGICRQVLVPAEQKFAQSDDTGISLLRFIRKRK